MRETRGTYFLEDALVSCQGFVVLREFDRQQHWKELEVREEDLAQDSWLGGADLVFGCPVLLYESDCSGIRPSYE